MARLESTARGVPVSWLFLIPISLFMGLVGLAAFFWALRNDQFNDPEGNARRVLTPDHPPEEKGNPHGDLAAQSENRNPAGRL